MGQLIDLTGKKNGRLTIVRRVPDRRRGWPRWLAMCDCGAEKEFDSNALRTTLSCGCLKRERMASLKARKTHGRSRSPIYGIWCKMRDRCENPKNKDYPKWGGRGISVCARWKKFENFLSDMGERPERMTIERLDNDGDYEPSNCKWASRKEQAWNTSRNRYFEINGESLILSEWARRLGTSTDTIDFRLKAGWPIEKALTYPVAIKRRRSRFASGSGL